MNVTRTVYSVKLKEALNELRPAFRELGQSLDVLTRKRAELAPQFMRTYTLWRRETHRPFIAFVHELDRTMPVDDRKAYRAHPSYRAADYLKQLATGKEKAARRGKTPLAMLAITIKSFLPLYGKNERDQKNAIALLMAATKWEDRDIKRLNGMIKRARPVALPNVPQLVDVAKATKAAIVAFERERQTA